MWCDYRITRAQLRQGVELRNLLLGAVVAGLSVQPAWADIGRIKSASGGAAVEPDERLTSHSPFSVIFALSLSQVVMFHADRCGLPGSLDCNFPRTQSPGRIAAMSELISHSRAQSHELEDAIRAARARINDAPTELGSDDELNAELDLWAQCELGRWMLVNQGWDAFWTRYCISYPARVAAGEAEPERHHVGEAERTFAQAGPVPQTAPAGGSDVTERVGAFVAEAGGIRGAADTEGIQDE